MSYVTVYGRTDSAKSFFFVFRSFIFPFSIHLFLICFSLLSFSIDHPFIFVQFDSSVFRPHGLCCSRLRTYVYYQTCLSYHYHYSACSISRYFFVDMMPHRNHHSSSCACVCHNRQHRYPCGQAVERASRKWRKDVLSTLYVQIIIILGSTMT